MRGRAAAARRAHNPKVGGSSPPPAIQLQPVESSDTWASDDRLLRLKTWRKWLWANDASLWADLYATTGTVRFQAGKRELPTGLGTLLKVLDLYPPPDPRGS